MMERYLREYESKDRLAAGTAVGENTFEMSDAEVARHLRNVETNKFKGASEVMSERYDNGT